MEENNDIIPDENIKTDVDGNMNNTIVHPINRFTEIVPSENIETDVDGDISIDVILVGDVPV